MICKVFILLMVMVDAVSCTIAKKCLKSSRAYPPGINGTLRINRRPSAPGAWHKCGMHENTCCNSLTEYYMQARAESDFPALLLSVVNDRLLQVNHLISNNSLTPTVFHEDFNLLVRQKGVVTNENLTKSALRHYVKESCLTDFYVVRKLIHELTDKVRLIANQLKAIYTGLNAIKNALQVAAHEKLSENCIEEVMKNGLYTSGTFDMVMCQVCHRDTSHLAPCKNTCETVASRCLASLSGINTRLNDLLSAFDFNNYHQQIVSSEQDILSSFVNNSFLKSDCWKESEIINAQKKFTSSQVSVTPLQLSNVIERSAYYACYAAKSNNNCWTANGWKEKDESPLPDFNYTLSVAGKEQIRKAEYLLSEAKQVANNVDSLEGPTSTREPSQEEHKIEPSQEEHTIEPTQEEHTIEPSQEEHTIEPSQEEHKIEPSKEEHKIEPSKEEHKIEPSQEELKIEPSNEEHKIETSQENGPDKKDSSSSFRLHSFCSIALLLLYCYNYI